MEEINFFRKVWKRCNTFEYLRDIFVDYFFGSLILCGYVSFSQLPRNNASKDINITYMYMFILVISISSYLNFSLLRIQCINILPIRKFIKKMYREFFFFLPSIIIWYKRKFSNKNYPIHDKAYTCKWALTLFFLSYTEIHGTLYSRVAMSYKRPTDNDAIIVI